MKYQFSWSEEKNKILKITRNISFEEVIEFINKNDILDTIKNSSINYSNQEMFVICINNYVYIIPFVRKAPNSNEIFLKTIYKSRKYKKQYLGVKK
ncbi:MAG: toxin [Elusimicrobiota bacterium]|jgi:hypothetical protein|nr:toxin [Elusimicrobiota bacterium]